MSEKQMCVICGEGAAPGKNLLSNSEMIDDLIQCCNERLSLGEVQMQKLCEKLNGLGDQERQNIKYHRECRKPIVNKGNIERLRTKRSRYESPVSSAHGPGRRSCASEATRPKRTKTATKSKVCIFSACDFCSNDMDDLHRVYSDNMGQTLLDIKQKTINDQVRTCVSDLHDSGDAAALEKWYHRNCLRDAQRTTETKAFTSSTLIRSICDEELLMSVQNTLTSDDITLNMAEINSEYISILKRYQIELTETANYRKYLKALITENLPSVQFVKSLRRNEPDTLVLCTAVSKAIELRTAGLNNDDKITGLRRTASVLRDEILEHRDWLFRGSFEDFNNPPLLQYFLSLLLFGRHVLKVSGIRNKEVDKVVDVSCQYLTQNCRTDRQVKHQPEKDDRFLQTVQTPLSVGLPLAIHSRVRDKNLVRNLQEVYIGSDYKKILDLEKCVEQAVLQRMNDTGGFCLPDFVKKGVNVWFAVDNIDLLEDTPTGQNTFHGTVVVINQQNVAGEPVNPPLVIPDSLQLSPELSFDVKYLPELTTTKAKPIRFGEYKLGCRADLISKDFTHTWALATLLATSDSTDTTTSVTSVITDECTDLFEASNIDTRDNLDKSTCASNIDTDDHNERLEATDLQAPTTDGVDSNNNALVVGTDQQHEPCGASLLPSGSVDKTKEYAELSSTEQKPEDWTQENSEEIILHVTSRSSKQKRLAKQEVMPTWAATKSLLLSSASSSHTRTNSEVIAPLFKTSPTDFTTLHTVLMLTQGISAVVVGTERRTIITLDLDLYSRALQIQQIVGNTNWILRAGALHIVFAALHALGKTIDGSGIDTCAIESGIYTSAALRGIYGGKAYKRGLEYHIITSLAIMMMRFDAISGGSFPEHIRTECKSLKQCLHDRMPDVTIMFENVQSWYSQNIKPQEEISCGEQAQFLLQYLEQVDSLLCLISACRSADWERYLAALENIIKYFFAHDLLNYARLMPVHLAQMNALEKEDPTTWEALKAGQFVVAKSEIPFTHLFTDQTLEQEIKQLKRHGGIVGLSQDESALDRLVTTTPHLTRIVRQYLNGFPKASMSSERSEHYQLSGEISVRCRENALKLRKSIEIHCKGNPFQEVSPLKSLVSSALVPQNAKDDIMHFAEKGQKQFETFVQDRLLQSSSTSIWDPMKKIKLKTFSNCLEKTRVRTGDKVIKLREERELFGRFLIIQGSRPELVPRLAEAIGEYEMSVVPRSLCAVDGSLYIPTDKANLMHAIEEVKPKHQETAQEATTEYQKRVLVVDAMAVVQGMKKTPAMRKMSDLREMFIRRIENMLDDFNEGRIVFDRYLDQSLKNKTRQKRSVTSTDFEIHPEMKLSMSLKELLSSSKTKSSLTTFLAQGLLEHFTNSIKCNLIVAFDNKIKSTDYEEQHTHEEADTLIPHQVLASVAADVSQEICVFSPDTDVFILLLDLASNDRLGPRCSLKFLTGRGRKYREIDILERVNAVGIRKCKGLIGLHNFSGADWGGKFVGISKKTWVAAYMKLNECDQAIDCFQKLGTGMFSSQLNYGELPPEIEGLEQFVCRVYCATGPNTLPELRWEMFRSRNLEGEMLPPTRAALLPHVTRANYISMRDKSYTTTCPDLPPIEQNGWQLQGETYVPVRCLAMPAPAAVIELTKCGCTTGCAGARCKCYRNKLPCTPLCKCYATRCENMIRDSVSESDVDDENDE